MSKACWNTFQSTRRASTSRPTSVSTVASHTPRKPTWPSTWQSMPIGWRRGDYWSGLLSSRLPVIMLLLPLELSPLTPTVGARMTSVAAITTTTIIIAAMGTCSHIISPTTITTMTPTSHSHSPVTAGTRPVVTTATTTIPDLMATGHRRR